MAVGEPEIVTQKRVINLFQHEDEQATMTKILSDMDAKVTALGGKLSKAREVKQGMMQELLTGKVRLV